MNQEYDGMIVAHFGHTVTVQESHGTIWQCHLRRSSSPCVVGDKVRFSPLEEKVGVITDILPSRSVVKRGDTRGNAKPLAANVDYLVIVMAPPPILSLEVVDRYTIAAELLGIKPLIVINKVDLLSQEAENALRHDLAFYEAISYPVCMTSCVKENGVDPLLDYLKQHTAVLMGPSGVGKSSLIARLTGHGSIRIGAVSDKGIGRHTTTTTQWYPLPGGGGIIDSPGLRDFQLWQIDASAYFQGFREFHEAGSCRFRDCKHLQEPDCAVKQQVAIGKIDPRRYAHYATWVQALSKK